MERMARHGPRLFLGRFSARNLDLFQWKGGLLHRLYNKQTLDSQSLVRFLYFRSWTVALVLEALAHHRYYVAFRYLHIQIGCVRGLMPQNYVPIFIFRSRYVDAASSDPILLAAQAGPSANPDKTKLMPYECGSIHSTMRVGVTPCATTLWPSFSWFLTLRPVFLFPWAVRFRALGLFGLIEMLVFLGILIIGYIWIWKKGALEWV